MKRPLFWTVMAFALGEVAYLYTDRIAVISIIAVMLICCTVTFMRKQECLVTVLALLGGLILGMANVAVNVTKPDIFYHFEKNDGDCRMKKYCGEKYDVVLCGGAADYSIAVSGSGVVWDVNPGSSGYNVTVKMLGTVSETGYCEDEYMVMLYGVDSDIVLGEIISVSGRLRKYSMNTNPGGFDMENYYQAREIYLYMNNPVVDIDTDVSGHVHVNKAAEAFLRYKEKLRIFRDSLEKSFYSLCSSQNASIYSGILLGNKKGIDADIKQLYRINGIAHILAISGLHVSLLGGMLYKLLRRLKISFLISGACSVFLVITYGFMTGFAPATIRAVIMLSMYIWGEVMGRSYDMLTGMALSLVIMLISKPYMITDGGMLLSFTAMFGVALGRYIVKRMSGPSRLKHFKKKHRVLFKFMTNLIFSASVNIITLPVIIYMYYEIPLYSLLVNMLVIPLMTVIVVSGIAALFAAYVNIDAARLIISPGELVLDLYDRICRCVLSLPGNTINIGKISIYQIIIFYSCIILLLVLSSEKIQRKIRDKIYKRYSIWFTFERWRLVMSFAVTAAVTICLCVTYMLHEAGKKESIVFLDVGQGDGILIRSRGGTNMVIDGGSLTNNSLGEYVMLPAIKYMGMADIDYWFITHTDSDHISGLEYILAEGELTGVKIRNLVVSENIVRDEALERIIAMAESFGVKVLEMGLSDFVTDGTFDIKCCHPDGDYSCDDKNQASLALSYSSEAYNVLLCGDMNSDALKYMLNNNSGLPERKYDIIKAAHHGSKNSICREIYDTAYGGFCVISCGLNNRYGHPHVETLEALKADMITVFRTDYDGAVMFIAK